MIELQINYHDKIVILIEGHEHSLHRLLDHIAVFDQEYKFADHHSGFFMIKTKRNIVDEVKEFIPHLAFCEFVGVSSDKDDELWNSAFDTKTNKTREHYYDKTRSG